MRITHQKLREYFILITEDIKRTKDIEIQNLPHQFEDRKESLFQNEITSMIGKTEKLITENYEQFNILD